jgi:hypothetical protein
LGNKKTAALHTSLGSQFDFHFSLPKNNVILRKIQGKNSHVLKKIQPKNTMVFKKIQGKNKLNIKKSLLN